MVADLDFARISTIVELGPGTGSFTELLIKRAGAGTKFILLEIEKSYIDLLGSKFGNQVILEHTSAHKLDEVLEKHQLTSVDLIVSGLPFLPRNLNQPLCRSVLKHVERGAIFRLFTYMPPVMKLVYKDLPLQQKKFVLKNVPPMWIYQLN